MTERIGTVAYHLALPDHAKIHPVFHVSQLKQYHGTPTAESFLPFPLHSMPEGLIYRPIEIMATRRVQQGQQWLQQFMVRWDGPLADSWEFEEELRRLYPSLNLEDKVPLYEGVL